MGHEARRLESPQRAVEIREDFRVGRIHHQPARLRVGLQREAACKALLLPGVAVEVDARHAARRSRKCERRPTGRPVAPFSAPDFHAVPAMSTCPHAYAFPNPYTTPAPV